MALISCNSCLHYGACKRWSSLMGEYALQFPYCKQDEKPCDLYTSRDEYEYNLAKAFTDKIKEHQYQSSDWSHGEHPYVVEVDDIDGILQDMELEEA